MTIFPCESFEAFRDTLNQFLRSGEEKRRRTETGRLGCRTMFDVQAFSKFLEANQSWTELSRQDANLRQTFRDIEERLGQRVATRSYQSLVGRVRKRCQPDLPMEIVQMIIQFLFDGHGDKRSRKYKTTKQKFDVIRMVNSSWTRQAEKALITRINEDRLSLSDVGFTKPDEVMNFVVSYGQKLTCLNLDGIRYTDQHLNKMITCCPNLSFIEICCCDIIDVNLKELAQLETLVVKCGDLSQFVIPKELVRMKTISLFCPIFKSYLRQDFIPKELTQLKNLEIRCSHIDLFEIPKECTQLENLLIDCISLKKLVILKELAQLKRIEVHCAEYRWTGPKLVISKELGRLEYLSVESGCELDDQSKQRLNELNEQIARRK